MHGAKPRRPAQVTARSSYSLASCIFVCWKSSFACNFLAACVTHRSMRNWMRERMKRRKKKPENETEATGKVGQQKPLVDESHPQPIVPAYDEVEL